MINLLFCHSDDLYSMSLANYAANLATEDNYETQHDELRSALDAKVIFNTGFPQLFHQKNNKYNL